MTTPCVLSDEQITEIAAREYRAGRLSWLGFKKDAEGRYTIPLITDSERALIRACLAAALSSSAAPPADSAVMRQALEKIAARCSTDDPNYTIASVGDTARAALPSPPATKEGAAE